MKMKINTIKFIDPVKYRGRTVKSITVKGNLGWIPDPEDPRDIQYALTSEKLSRYSDSVNEIDNRHRYKHVSNQFNFPSCAANSGADYLEAVIAKRKKMNPEFIPDLSRMFVWWNARNEMQPNMAHDDSSGTYNRLVLDVGARFGVPPEEIWPYDNKVMPNGFRRPVCRPSLKSYVNARKYTIRSYHAIMESGSERVSLIIKALNRYVGVIAGFRLGKAFYKYNGGVLDKPSAKDFEGNHSMIIVGYSAHDNAFLVRNHWGTGWGEKGYCWIRTDWVADSKKCGSIWVAD